MHKDVYKISNKEELKKLDTSKDYVILSKILKYYNMIDDYDSIKRIVLRNDLDLKSDKNKNLIYFYRCLVAKKDKDDYAKEKLLYYLPEEYKVRFNINNERNIYGLATIFEKNIKDELNKWLKKDELLTYKMYFAYYFHKKQGILKIEKKMKKNFYSILKKEEISFEELDYLIFIIDLYRKIYIINMEDISFIKKLDTNLDDMRKASYIALKNIDFYEKIMDNKKKTYVDIVCNFLKFLINRLEDEKYIRECIETINKYEVNNIHYDFLNKISRMKPNDYDEKTFINEIERIIHSNDGENISTIISLYSAKKMNKSKQESFIHKLIEIKSKNIPEVYKKEINVGIEEFKFWNGEKFDLSVADGFYNTIPFLTYLIKYDNKMISYDEFLESINKIGKIDSLIINNWERVEKIFENDNIDWLITIIVNLNDISTHDYNLFNMLNKKFIKLLENDGPGLFLYDFSRLESAVSCIDNDFHFCYYSSLIYITKYNVFDDNCFQLIDLTLKYHLPKRKDKKNFYEIVKNYIFNITQAMILHSKYEILKEVLVFSKEYLSQEDYLLIYSITLFGNNAILSKTYSNCIIYLNDIFNETQKIQKDNYKMITCITGKIITGEITSNFNISDKLVFEEDNIEENESYKEELKSIYKEHQSSEEDKKENIVSILLQKIYFKYIEKFHAGKIIKFNMNASGEEIIKELSAVVGHEEIMETQNKIYEGFKITQPWLNILQVHDIFKSVKKGNNLMFKNTSNRFFILQDYIIQPSALVLLSKLDLLSKISKENHLNIFNSLVIEIKKLKEYDIIDYAEIYEKTQVAYDELLNNCYKFVEKLPKKKIIEVTNANVLGFKDIDRINRYDVDVLKELVTSDGNITFITDDPFYLESNIFKNKFYSTFSYILSLYFNDIITSNELFRCSSILKQMNYNMTVDKSIWRFLLEKGNDESIKKVIDIIN